MVWSNQSISVFSLFPRNYWNTPTFTDTVSYCNYQKEKQNTSLLELTGSSSLEVFWGQVKPFLAVCYFYLDKHLRHMRVRRYRCRQQVKIPHLEVDDAITPLMCAHVCMAQSRWLKSRNIQRIRSFDSSAYPTGHKAADCSSSLLQAGILHWVPNSRFHRLDEGFFSSEWWLEHWGELHKAVLAKIKQSLPPGQLC